MENNAQKIERYEEIERRGLLGKLPIEKQRAWAEIKRRNEMNASSENKPKMFISAGQEPFKTTWADRATSNLKGYTAGLGNALLAGMGAAIDKMKGNNSPFMDLVGEFGQAIEDRQEEYNKMRPLSSKGAELLGAIASAPVNSVGKGLAKLGGNAVEKLAPKISSNVWARSAGQGMAYSAPYIMIDQAQELGTGKKNIGEILLDSPKILAGAAMMGAGGKFAIDKAVLPLIKAPFSLADMIKNKLNAYSILKERVGEPAIRKAIESGKPLIDTADAQTMDLLEGVKLSDPKARQIIRDYAQKRIGKEQPEKIDRMIDVFLGRRSVKEALDEIKSRTEETENALYEKARAAGDIAIKIKSPRVLSAAKEALKSTPELAQGAKSMTDMRVLDLAKRKLDEKASAAYNKGDNTLGSILTRVKNELLADMDAKVPAYKQARAAHEYGKKLEALVSEGKNINKRTPENIRAILANASKEERAAFATGAKEAVLEALSKDKSFLGNPFQRAFDPATLRRLEAAGIAHFGFLERIANAENRAARNITALLGGSPTAERVGSMQSIVKFARNPIDSSIESFINKIAKNKQNEQFTDVAKALTDSKYLADLKRKNTSGIIKTQSRDLADMIDKIYHNRATAAMAKILGNNKGFIGTGPSGEKSKKIAEIIKAEQEEIAKGYSEVLKNPFKGTRIGKDDVLATLKPSELKNYIINRGAAIKDSKTGDIIVQGEALKKATGTEGNFGFSKLIFKHGTTLEDVQRTPRIIREYEPYKISNKKENYRIPINDKENLLVVFGENESKNNRLITIFREKKDVNNIYSKKRPLDASANSGAIAETTNQVAGDANKESQRPINKLSNNKQVVKPRITQVLTNKEKK